MKQLCTVFSAPRQEVVSSVYLYFLYLENLVIWICWILFLPYK